MGGVAPKSVMESRVVTVTISEWLLVRQPAQQINIKQYVYIALCIPHILFYIRVRVRVRVDFILFC